MPVTDITPSVRMPAHTSSSSRAVAATPPWRIPSVPRYSARGVKVAVTVFPVERELVEVQAEWVVPTAGETLVVVLTADPIDERRRCHPKVMTPLSTEAIVSERPHGPSPGFQTGPTGSESLLDHEGRTDDGATGLFSDLTQCQRGAATSEEVVDDGDPQTRWEDVAGDLDPVFRTLGG